MVVLGARFQVSQVAINAPGNCFVCKTTLGPFIVTGLRHDFWKEAPDASHDGDVYFCSACIREMASTLNLESVDVQAQINEARRAGVVEGVLLGKKVLDEFTNGFIDSSLGFGLVLNVPVEPSGSSVPEDFHSDDTDTEATTEDTQQGSDVDEDSGRDDLSGSSVDGVFGDE